MYDSNCFTYQKISSIPPQLARITTSYCSSPVLFSLRPGWQRVTLIYGKHVPPLCLNDFDSEMCKNIKKNQTLSGNIFYLLLSAYRHICLPEKRSMDRAAGLMLAGTETQVNFPFSVK